MEKTYQPQQIESNWYTHWENSGFFKPSGKGTPYSIMIPPPNVTGNLHMGHAFQYVIMDTLIRFHRMQGDNTLWQVGTDHAGIATQMVVERQLQKEGISRQTIGRDAFEQKIWEWKEKSGSIITEQMRRIGISADWTRERFTLDDGLSDAVREVFIQLHKKNLIYRGKRLVNWDPTLHTAISDLEVISQEEQGSLWHLRYPLTDGSGTLIVATTRPETMLGDTAVAVHPKDDRYQHLIGKTISLPLTNREIPIIADDYVEADFGSGCVKITPAHDFNDYAMGKRHQLPIINILTPDAKLNENVPEKYQGLDRFDARKQILDELSTLNLLEKTEPHTLKVPRGDRSGVVIEPYLTDQWFVSVESLAKPAIDAVSNGDIKFVPKNWENTYFSWMNDIQDWCISRQLWWGHRIPAWYDNQGNIYVGKSEKDVRLHHKLGDISLRQDEDVLDTWFSSALWSFSTLGWPNQTAELNTFHPTNVLVTGFDIIFFWVARMIMMSLEFTQEVPFHTIYIHGLVRDGHGQKMSKSKGNVLDPIDLIDGIELDALVHKRTKDLMQADMAKSIETSTRDEFPDGICAFGTDALRFTFCSLAATGRDIKFDLNRIEGYRNFCNKLWNAARYVLMQTDNQDCGQADASLDFSLADRWIISKLQDVESQALEALANYRFDHLAQTLYEFTWNEYCDWYLELSKPILWDENLPASQHRATRYTLVRVLEAILRLLHPIIPFITEEIWQRIAALAGKSGDSIMLEAYPSPNATKVDNDATTTIEWLKSVILAVRNIRGEMDIPPGKSLTVLLQGGSIHDQNHLQQTHHYLEKIGKLASIEWLDENTTPPAAATQLVGDMKILVPMAGLIDKTEELARLTKNMQKIIQETQRLENKLANPKFVNNAPEDVVSKEKQKLATQQSALQKLKMQFETVNAL